MLEIIKINKEIPHTFRIDQSSLQFLVSHPKKTNYFTYYHNYFWMTLVLIKGFLVTLTGSNKKS